MKNEILKCVAFLTRCFQAFEEWIENLPNKSSPLLLGLPATAEQKVQSDLGNKCLAHLSSVQTAFDTETVISAGSDHGGKDGTGTSRLSGVQGTVELWLKTLPEVSSLPSISSDKSSDVTASSMDRCLAREIVKASQVLSRVRKDLELVKYVYTFHDCTSLFLCHAIELGRFVLARSKGRTTLGG